MRQNENIWTEQSPEIPRRLKIHITSHAMCPDVLRGTVISSVFKDLICGM